MILKDIIKKFDKSNIKAGDGLERGKYPLYTCSPVVNKYLNDYFYEDEALIISTGGKFSIHYVNGKFNYSTDCYVFKTDKYNQKYLYYYLLSKRDDINKMFRGAGLKHLNKNEFVMLNIKDISLNEQYDIVNQLDKINKIIELRKNEIEKCNNLVKSQFVEMFERSNYNIKRLGDVCTKITDGTHKTPLYQLSGVTFISAKNIVNEKLDFSDVKYISESEYNEIQNRCQTEKGDILLSKSGSLGIPVIFNEKFPVGLFESLAVIKYDRDILIEIIVKKNKAKVAYEYFRNQATDFPVLTCAMSLCDNNLNIAVGARPMKAMLVSTKYDDQNISKSLDKFVFSSNMRASKNYRYELCKVLISRCLKKIKGENYEN